MTEHICTDTDTLRHLEEMYRRGEIDQERLEEMQRRQEEISKRNNLNK